MRTRLILPCVLAMLVACKGEQSAESTSESTTDADTSTSGSTGTSTSTSSTEAGEASTSDGSAAGSSGSGAEATSDGAAESSGGSDDTAGGVCAPMQGEDLPAMTPCDPLEQNCGDAMGCYFQTPVGGCTFECVATYGLGFDAGEACEFLNDCMPGMACLDAAYFQSCAGVYCCAPYCDLDTPSCASGGACISFFAPDPVPPGFEHVGVCVGP